MNVSGLPSNTASQSDHTQPTPAANAELPSFADFIESAVAPSKDRRSDDDSDDLEDEEKKQTQAEDCLDPTLLLCTLPPPPPVVPQAPQTTPPSPRQPTIIEQPPTEADSSPGGESPTAASTPVTRPANPKKLETQPNPVVAQNTAKEPPPTTSPPTSQTSANSQPPLPDLPPPPPIDGMGIAQSGVSVRLMQQLDETTLSGQKNLPTALLLVEPSRKAARLADASSPFVAASMTSGNGTTPQETPDVVHAAPASLHRVEQLEKLHATATECALLLRQTGKESVSVVIKPDAGTELQLHLRMRDGIVEASAEMHKGNSAALEAGWKELQQRLERQGIQIAPLEHSQSFTTGERREHKPQRQDSSEMDRSLPPGDPARHIQTGSRNPQPAPTNRACEFWA
jgi:hypothetical protein